MTQNKHRPWGLIILTTVSLTFMGLLAQVDYAWTLWLNDHRFDPLADFMHRTLFGNGLFGGSDLGILMMILPGVAYFFAYPGSRFVRLQRYRVFLGFVVFTTLGTGIGLVHSLKWMLGRARPYMVLKRDLPFTHWFEFGPQHISDGPVFGSMPSGHTATAILMIMFAYFLAADSAQPLRNRILGWLWGGLVLVYSGLMVVGRSMTLHHWLTDSVGVIMIDWIAIHIIFFYGLKIPQQLEYVRNHGRYPDLSRYWELRLLWRCLIIAATVSVVVIGIKAVVFQDAPILILVLIPALPIGYFGGRNLVGTYRELIARFTIP